jgi:hypothetical protein
MKAQARELSAKTLDVAAHLRSAGCTGNPGRVHEVGEVRAPARQMPCSETPVCSREVSGPVSSERTVAGCASRRTPCIAPQMLPVIGRGTSNPRVNHDKPRRRR